MNQFIPQSVTLPSNFEGKVKWESPSNIALVKYWGKTGNQIPANSSISFTLSSSKTITSIAFSRASADEETAPVQFFFEGKPASAGFGDKTLKFFDKVKSYFPFLADLNLVIESENTFPHSSGIASSASGMSAMALCLMSIEKQLSPTISDEYFYQKASFISRLGSGSACRSVYGGLATWGKSSIANSDDLYAVPVTDVHPVFTDFQDTILLIEKGQKEVSSTVGHGLMHNNPYAETRFKQANEHTAKITEILKSGDLTAFGELVELEALTLHGMMMTSTPYFMLMKPNTVAVLHKVWEFRKATKTPLYFTLDAGANVHLLYPNSFKQTVMEFIKSQLVGYCQNQSYLCDHVGVGPKALL